MFTYTTSNPPIKLLRPLCHKVCRRRLDHKTQFGGRPVERAVVHFCDGACDVLFTILPPGFSNTCRPGPQLCLMERGWAIWLLTPGELFLNLPVKCQAMVEVVGLWLHHRLCWASTNTTTHAASLLNVIRHSSRYCCSCFLTQICLFQGVKVRRRVDGKNGRNWFCGNIGLRR